MYAHSGLHEQAVDSYIESVYAIPSVSQDANGRTWLAVGKVETQLGQSQLAIRAYLQAAYSAPDLSDQACNGLAQVFKEKASKSMERTRGELTAKTALKIADLYRQHNVHPLALRVLSESHIRSDAEVSKQRLAIEKEWLGVVNTHKQQQQQLGGGELVLLGVKASDVKSWADVHILRPSDTYWKPR